MSWILVKDREGTPEGHLTSAEEEQCEDNIRKADKTWINKTRRTLKFKMPGGEVRLQTLKSYQPKPVVEPKREERTEEEQP